MYRLDHRDTVPTNRTVVVGSFAHETNTFVDEPVTRAAFRARTECFGDAIVERFDGTETAVGGIVAASARSSDRQCPSWSRSTSTRT